MDKDTAILFGGAKGPGDNYELQNDTFLFKSSRNIWIQLVPKGELPCKRAAHSSETVEGKYLIIYGGSTEKGNFAPDILHVLDLSKGHKNCKWVGFKAENESPGKRYGHTMVVFHSFLVIFGGNKGKTLSNEVWITDIKFLIKKYSPKFWEETKPNDYFPVTWKSLEINGTPPEARTYHASRVCKYGNAANMIIIFGGRNSKSEPLNDCWGLRRHRNGKWDWLNAPYANNYTPFSRYLHTIVFYYKFVIVIGGKCGKKIKKIPIEVYDTESNEWYPISHFYRYRHCSWIIDNWIYTHGGFEHGTSQPDNQIIKLDVMKVIALNQNLKKSYELFIENIVKTKEIKEEKKTTPTISPIGGQKNDKNNDNKNLINKNTIEKLPMSNLISQKPLIQKFGEMAIESKSKEEITIEKFEFDDKGNIKNKAKDNDNKNIPLYDKFIDYLLKPSIWLNQESCEENEEEEEEDEPFNFTKNEIYELINQCINIIKNQPNLLRINTPVKVFGDIHGQYNDLMNFFDKWGCPKEGANGDIMINDYLFLGDYVDRGNKSLETICLLMALKIKYPDQIHLLRGNHEDILVNSNFGFEDECAYRLNDDTESENSLFELFNTFFEYLPLGAIIDDQILCLHGGIGANVHKISDIEKIKRPFEVIHEATKLQEKIVMDILWSDPTDNDQELGIKPNTQRDSNNLGVIVKYGPDVVKKFLADNNLSYIIRAHECVLDGFERFAGGLLLTVFSATDYCGRSKNAGAMIIINQQKEMIPHLIYPPAKGNKNWIKDDDYYQKRPPTPPRIRYNQQTY